MYRSFTTILSTYRGDSSVLDYSLAGFVTGTLYRLNTGLQGSLVGGILGNVSMVVFMPYKIRNYYSTLGI